MALAVVGGAFLGAVFNVLLDRIASPEIQTFFKTKKLDHLLLPKLRIKLLSIHGVLEDAEGKQFRNAAVKDWLDELKDAAFVADDLFDEIYTESKATANEVHSSNSASVNSLDKKFEQKIEEILARLECLVEEKGVLSLQEGVGTKWSSKTPTSSLVEESGVFGRDSDREVIIQLLLSEDPNGKRISVIPIVGMGGIGKTTLAQLVYNDDRVEGKFDLKAWVYVSEEFNVVRVTKVILEAITSHASNTNDLDSLQVDLKGKLSGKKFLIVLDDVWNEKYDEWCNLQVPFQYGAHGSKVIVTTRSRRVASFMQTTQPHYLEHLSDDDCWNLFAKHAFDNENSSKQTLEEIGRNIVNKCKGLPLAAKTLGGLLRSKNNIEEWENILGSDLWDLSENESRIIPAVLLSYYYLPSHLKECFAYCSIYPKGYEFRKNQLILFWMAENLLQKPKGNKRIEEVGDEYFHELVSRSFLQQSRYTKSLFGMHDVINDLVQFVSGKFCIRLESHDGFQKIETRTRHVSLKYDYGSIDFEEFHKAKNLRTWLPFCWPLEERGELHKKFLRLSYLRVLSLACFLKLDKLPDSIVFLTHLRYLDVSMTRIKWLPESLCSLYNLQTLKAVNCWDLIKLPEGLHNLINLRYLDIRNCFHLKGMSPHVGKLRSLQELSDFIVGNEDGCSVSELGQLLDLRGSLTIHNLQHVVDVGDAKDAKLNCKQYLRRLCLDWSMSSSMIHTNDSRHEKDVLDSLRPHPRNLKVLLILYYTGTGFPEWVGDPSFNNLVFVKLYGCKYCCILPPFGQLPSLKRLYIQKCEEVVRVGQEFYGPSCAENAIQPFASLEFLSFYDMGAWEIWSHLVGNESYRAFPSLKRLRIIDCPRLIGDLPSNLRSADITINNCPKFFSPNPDYGPRPIPHSYYCTAVIEVDVRDSDLFFLDINDNDYLQQLYFVR